MSEKSPWTAARDRAALEANVMKLTEERGDLERQIEHIENEINDLLRIVTACIEELQK